MAEITVKKYPANIIVFVDGIRTYIDIDGLSFDDEIDVERSIDIDLSMIESNIEMNLSDDDKEKISNELRFYYGMMIEKNLIISIYGMQTRTISCQNLKCVTLQQSGICRSRMY